MCDTFGRASLAPESRGRHRLVPAEIDDFKNVRGEAVRCHAGCVAGVGSDLSPLSQAANAWLGGNGTPKKGITEVLVVSGFDDLKKEPRGQG